jgi:phospholipid/cholesterol/gamma-HCH transport system ATP-binding protein
MRTALGMSNVPPLIEVRDLVKRFDGRTVLDGVDLTVERGETIVVVGGSGSGKTTLARLLIGLDRPTSGQVLLDGVDLTTLDDSALIDVRRRFAMVFQKYALLDSINVFDNVAFPLREERRHDETTIRQRVMVTLRELGVEGAAEKLPAELSGGMAKRVGIARALVTEPEILVYDEPTSGLDPVTSRVVDGLIERMRERHLVTSIVITHDMMTAYAVADRIVLLARGKVAADGDPETIFRSNNEDILPFAVSSGVDLTRLGPRKARSSPSEVRARWAATHPAPSTPAPAHRFRLWHSA